MRQPVIVGILRFATIKEACDHFGANPSTVESRRRRGATWREALRPTAEVAETKGIPAWRCAECDFLITRLPCAACAMGAPSKTKGLPCAR